MLKHFMRHPNDGVTLVYKGYFLYWSDGDLVVMKNDEEVANLTCEEGCDSYFKSPLDKALKRILVAYLKYAI